MMSTLGSRSSRTTDISSQNVVVSSKGTNIYEKPLIKSRGEVNLDLYLLLFSEMVQYSRSRVSSVSDLENMLSQMGSHVGIRVLEYLSIKDKSFKKEIRVVNCLNLIVTLVWKYLFGKVADSLKKVNNTNDEYYIEEFNPMVNKFIAVPKDYGALNCAAFNGGIIEGILSASGFKSKVSTFFRDSSVKSSTSSVQMTIYFIKLDQEVLQRERSLDT
mmetsp:Transcript_2755/g.4846  ORF Transcript_2755/g.4846 Transcript_2755/m.4846 type:complete len:216 (+) Transcript_2755:28-675(+)